MELDYINLKNKVISIQKMKMLINNKAMTPIAQFLTIKISNSLTFKRLSALQNLPIVADQLCVIKFS